MLASPALAVDRVQYYYGINPPSQWANQQQRQLRLGLGGAWQALWGTAGGYYNLSVAPAGGLNVQVQPTTLTSVGSLYQYIAEDPNPFGSGTSALAADTTTTIVQGTLDPQVSPSVVSVGAVLPGTSSGQSIANLVECQVQVTDLTSQTQNFYNSIGIVSQTSVTRDRRDLIACQIKSSTSAVTPTTPTLDTGWIGIGVAVVPYSTVTVTTGMITAYANSLPLWYDSTNSWEYVSALKVGSLTPSQCVATNSSGQLISTGATCGSGSGSVTGVTGTAPIVSSGGTAPAISCATCVVLSPGSTQSGSIAVSAQIQSNAALCSIWTGSCSGTTPGDGMFARSASTGVIYLGSNTVHYLYFDGSNYVFGSSSSISAATGAYNVGTSTFANGSAYNGSAYYTPIYTASGGNYGTGSKEESGTFSVTISPACNPQSVCSLSTNSLSFSGSGVWTSGTSYECTYSTSSQNSNGYNLNWVAGGGSQTSSVTYFLVNNVDTYATIANNTVVKVAYFCRGN